jgi:CHAD domain-containing protein
VRDRSQRKLLKLLSRIRRRAGRIRDIDVQLAALRSFRVPQEPRRKTQLMQRLIDFRVQHEQKLAKLLNKKDLVELTKRIRRASHSLRATSNRDPLVLANEMLRATSTAGPLSDEILHRYRIAVKRARYAAEFAPRSAERDSFIAGLKQLQDALGSWHDWMTLTRTAARHLGEIEQSSLVAALHNVTRVKFRHAVAALSLSPTDSVVVNPAAHTPKPARRSAASHSRAA